MLRTLFLIGGWCYLIWLVCDSSLKITGWTDPQERKQATAAIITKAVLDSSEKTPKK